MLFELDPNLYRQILSSNYTYRLKVTFVRPAHLIDPATVPFDLDAFVNVYPASLCIVLNYYF